MTVLIEPLEWVIANNPNFLKRVASFKEESKGESKEETKDEAVETVSDEHTKHSSEDVQDKQKEF